MDFNKLTEEEVSSILQQTYPGYNFNNPYEKVAETFQIIDLDRNYPDPLIDLYIAHILYENGIEIPPNYNINILPKKDFLELATLYHLPPIDNNNIRQRAARITRIINDMKKGPYYEFVAKVDLFPIPFYGNKNYGDFLWMINKPEYKDFLFVFDETQEDFIKFANYLESGNEDSSLCNRLFKGLQQYQCGETPKTVGIPVATYENGYQDTDEALPYIESAIEYIMKLVATGKYKQIAYPAEHDGRTFRTNYNVSSDIKEYIVRSLEHITQ